jgi:N-acetylglucosaminyldiphosphoundecaprenol N-acetyl-beta-D-mannosaminyltransferase
MTSPSPAPRADEWNPATAKVLPRAALTDVLLGRASLLGSRWDPGARRGFVSPIEARARLGLIYGDPVALEAQSLAERELVRRASGQDIRGLLEDLGVVSRSLLTQRIWPAGGARSQRRPFIVSAQVDNVTFREALATIFEPPDGGRARMIHFVHPHSLNLAAFDRDHRARLARADALLPDGVGLRVAASILGISLRGNVNGTDLLPLVCREARSRGVPLALIGAAPGVAEQCAERLTRAARGLRIPLVSHGYLGATAAHAVAARIRSLGRVVALVGMGSPLQERWACRYLASAPDATAVTVGGLFDFFSGRLPRAPEAVRDLGLEWLYRLSLEPRRLARRYLVGNPLFVLLALRQRAFGPSP